MGKPLLLVEDDQIFRGILKKIFEGFGFEVREAETGLVAKQIFDLNRQHFALIVSDVRLPGMDGVAFLKHVRTVNKDVKFILMTGFSDITEAQEAYKIGASEFLAKPFRLDNLKNVIHAVENGEVQVTGGPQYSQVPVESFISGTPLACDLFVRLQGHKYIQVAFAGDTIPLDRLRIYKDKKIDFFFVRSMDLAKGKPAA